MLDCMLSLHETLGSISGMTNKTKTRIWIHCISLSTFFLGIFFTLSYVCCFFQSHVINSFYFSCVCLYIAYVHACVVLGIESRAFSCVYFDRCPSIVTYHYMHIFTQMPSVRSKHMLVHMCVLTCTSKGGHHMSEHIYVHMCVVWVDTYLVNVFPCMPL